jgi:hypothetical protein
MLSEETVSLGDASGEQKKTTMKSGLFIGIFLALVMLFFNRASSPESAERQLAIIQQQHQAEMRLNGLTADSRLGGILESQEQEMERKLHREIALRRLLASPWFVVSSIAFFLFLSEIYWFRVYRTKGYRQKDAFFRALIHFFQGSDSKHLFLDQAQVEDDIRRIEESQIIKRLLIGVVVMVAAFVIFMLVKVTFQS